MKLLRFAPLLLAIALCLPAADATDTADDTPWIVLEGKEGAGKGKHIVLLSGDQEYRSEETLPQLAKILATRHGFKCTVLFTIDPKDGTINPTVNNVPGLEALKTADLLVIFSRFLNLPDDQMQMIVDYVEAGKPVVGLRTSTHAFNIPKDRKFAKYGNGSAEAGWEGGFGKQVLGEKWVNHHGAHGKQGTRGITVKGQENHPILKGIKEGEIFGTTDVYTVSLPLAASCTPIVLGQVTETLLPDSKGIEGPKNDPMMPVAWTNAYKAPNGSTARVFTTTMGASQDLQFEGTRRMIVNGCYWAAWLDGKIPDKANVELVGTFKPTAFRFKKNEEWKPGVKPAELAK